MINQELGHAKESSVKDRNIGTINGLKWHGDELCIIFERHAADGAWGWDHSTSTLLPRIPDRPWSPIPHCHYVPRHFPPNQESTV